MLISQYLMCFRKHGWRLELPNVELSSLTTKLCACAYIALVRGVISLAVDYNRLIRNLSSYLDLIISVLDRRWCGLFPCPGIPVPSAPSSWPPTNPADWTMDLHTAQPWPYKPGNTATYLRHELTRELRVRSWITNQNSHSWIRGPVQIALYHSCKECHLAGCKILF
jgi:hypothetical protein